MSLTSQYQSDIILMSEGGNVHVAGERTQGASGLAHGGAAVDRPNLVGLSVHLVHQSGERIRDWRGDRGVYREPGLPQWIRGHQPQRSQGCSTVRSLQRNGQAAGILVGESVHPTASRLAARAQL